MQIIHLVDTYVGRSESEQDRNLRAARTWRGFDGSEYKFARVRRWSGLPRLGDMIDFGFGGWPSAVMMLTNADSCLVTDWRGLVECGGSPSFGWSHRLDVSRARGELDSVRAWQIGRFHGEVAGVDCVWMDLGWWEEVGRNSGVGECLLGREAWDWMFRFMMGVGASVGPIIYHEEHAPSWKLSSAKDDLGALGNRSIARSWFDRLSDFDKERVTSTWPAILTY